LGYTGGVVRLLHPHAFAINGHTYYQVYPANAKGYLTNWFVYDAEARNCIANQRKLDQEIAYLIIQQPTNNAEVAACTIIHSTAVIQERHIQIWHVGKKIPIYISILNENYEALQYPLFFSHGEIGWRSDWASVTVLVGENNEMIDEIKDYINTRYLSAMEAVWRIFKYRITSQLPLVTCLLVHLPGEQTILQGGNNNLSTLQHYFLHLTNIEFDALTYCKYYKLYTFTYAKDLVNQQLLPPNNYLEKEQEVNGTLYSNFQDAARAFELLEDINENEQCFAEAVTYKCTPAQLRLFFCHLILEGENDTLMWIASFLEEHGSQITQFGLPQLSEHLDKITHIQARYNDYNTLIAIRDKMISELNFEQKNVYQKIMNHVLNNKPLLIFINGRAGRRKTFLINVIYIAIRCLKKIILPCITTGLVALNYDRGRTAYSLFRIPIENNDEEYKYQINLDSDLTPVIPYSGRTAIILKLIKSSLIWKSFEVYKLKQPVRDVHDLEYSQLMDKIGNGIDGENVSLALLKMTHEINDVIDFAFPETMLNDPNKLRGDVVDLYSTDSLVDNDTRTNQAQRNMISVELLNTFNASRIPKHCLTLKKGCVATIMRNLSIHDSLCKNSRVIILNIGRRLVTIQNPATGSVIYLPRITFLFCVPQFLFKISCHQFPLRLAYSSTFNSSQGLTLDRVALNLCTLVFSHRQLYTALTRVRQ
ncbi:4490_t:CDS:2, partial [Scutellospora calospora]